jgi:hypothetical protein
MMKRLLALTFLPVLIFSCKPSKEKMMEGRWQATHLENPTLDAQVAQLKAFLDTVGNNTTPEQNEVLYGVKNIDSLKQIQLAQIVRGLQEQAKELQNTFLNFQADGKVIYSFGSKPDTACWYFEGEQNLVLDEKKLKGVGNIVKMEIITLTKEQLQLRFQEHEMSSTATFIHNAQ